MDEKVIESKSLRIEQFDEFTDTASKRFNSYNIRNKKFFSDFYSLVFHSNNNTEDFPKSYRIGFGTRPISRVVSHGSINLGTETGSQLFFHQQPNATIVVVLYYPTVNNSEKHEGLNLGTYLPGDLLKAKIQKRLLRRLVVSMSCFSFMGEPDCWDKLKIKYYQWRYPRIIDRIEQESSFAADIRSLLKWILTGFVGGCIAGYTQSWFSTTIKQKQVDEVKESISGIHKGLSSIDSTIIEASTNTISLTKVIGERDSLANESITKKVESMDKQLKQLDQKLQTLKNGSNQ